MTVYYASDEDSVDVPNLTGFDAEDARRLLASLGLVLGEQIFGEVLT